MSLLDEYVTHDLDILLAGDDPKETEDPPEIETVNCCRNCGEWEDEVKDPNRACPEFSYNGCNWFPRERFKKLTRFQRDEPV